MTNLTANINENGYLWLEGAFAYYDDSNPTIIIPNKPDAINGADITGYSTWIEITRTFGTQTSVDLEEITGNQYEIARNNPKGTILTIRVHFVHPTVDDEIVTNSQNIQFGINQRTGTLPSGIIPETKILDKAFIDFVIIGKTISFYNISGQKVSEGAFNDLLNVGDLKQSDWNQTETEQPDFIKNKPEWIKGKITVSDILVNPTPLDTIFEPGIYEIFSEKYMTFSSRNLYAFLIVTPSYFGGTTIYECRQTLVILSSQIKERTYKGTWTAWEHYAYQSDLTPLLEDITTLQDKTPTQGTKTATSTGTRGQMAYDDDYFYICTATDTWVRFAKSAW